MGLLHEQNICLPVVCLTLAQALYCIRPFCTQMDLSEVILLARYGTPDNFEGSVVKGGLPSNFAFCYSGTVEAAKLGSSICNSLSTTGNLSAVEGDIGIM